MFVLREGRFATETTTVRRIVFHNFELRTSVRMVGCLANIRPLARVDSTMAGQTR